jgi:hypothetical protein
MFYAMPTTNDLSAVDAFTLLRYQLFKYLMRPLPFRMTDTATNSRRFERKPLEKPVEVATGLGPNLTCMMKDISQTGARLSAAYGWAAPDVFLLILGPELQRWCQVVWRKDHEIGVQFVSPPHSVCNGRTKVVLDS